MNGETEPRTGNAHQPPATAAGDASWRSDVRRMWEGADYPAIAASLRPAAREVSLSAGRGAGRSALDLATGTGTVAFELAEAGWAVIAIDLAARLMSIGRRHATTAGLTVEFIEASMTQIPSADASVDLVTSGFGLIFAPDPREALNEISRVLRTGGRLVLSAWTPAGTMGQMTSLIGEFLNHHKIAMAPFRWGGPLLSDTWLRPQFTDIEHHTHALHLPFDSPDEATQWFFDRSPGHRSALLAAGEQGPGLIAAVTTWMTQIAGGDHAFDLSPTYLISTARRL